MRLAELLELCNSGNDVDPGVVQLQSTPAGLPRGAPVEPDGDATRTRLALRLYVAGITPSSMRAIASVRALCAKYLQDRCDLKVVDVYQQPALAARDHIFATPTLLRARPLPVKRLTGDLSGEDRVLAGLDLLEGQQQ